jgi:CRP/FNR family transcriptional regulator, cyclic AMP receptor protein
MPTKKERPFDVQAFLESAGLGKRNTSYPRMGVIFSQGDPCDSVMYLRSGGIRVSVLSHAGKEAIVATLGPGDFLGEGAIAGHPVRLETARATMASTVLVIPKRQMLRLLKTEHTFSDRFLTHMLVRNARLEADLWAVMFSIEHRAYERCLMIELCTPHSTLPPKPPSLL